MGSRRKHCQREVLVQEREALEEFCIEVAVSEVAVLEEGSAAVVNLKFR